MDTQNIKYLDPKNDLTFRKIFGEHPTIMMSFLNSILPLEKEQRIISLSYEDPGLIPFLPELKHSIVDVRCTDNFDRQFIVEMQMYWTNSFKSRMLFNSSKTFVKQIDKGHQYSELKPVYGLSLIDDIFLTGDEYKDKYYHHYRLAHTESPDEIIEGIELIFIELPKFKALNLTEKKVRILWLRFLTEINEQTENIPKELLSEDKIKEALEILQASAFTKEELAYYEKYWDRVRLEKTAINDAKKETQKAKTELEEAKLIVEQERKEKEEARQKEKEARQKEKEAKLIAEQERKEKEEAKRNEWEIKIRFAKMMKGIGKSVEEIEEETGLSKEEIKKL